jgi:hypothetical protein
MAEPWSHAPCVFVHAPACPSCGSLDLLTIRSEQNGDGSTTRKTICRRCSKKFKVVVELPDSGSRWSGVS